MKIARIRYLDTQGGKDRELWGIGEEDPQSPGTLKNVREHFAVTHTDVPEDMDMDDPYPGWANVKFSDSNGNTEASAKSLTIRRTPDGPTAEEDRIQMGIAALALEREGQRDSVYEAFLKGLKGPEGPDAPSGPSAPRPDDPVDPTLADNAGAPPAPTTEEEITDTPRTIPTTTDSPSTGPSDTGNPGDAGRSAIDVVLDVLSRGSDEQLGALPQLDSLDNGPTSPPAPRSDRLDGPTDPEERPKHPGGNSWM